MAKGFVVAIWMAVVLLLAGLLFAIHLPVLGVALIIFEFAMGIAIAVWRPDRARAGAAEETGPARSTAGTAATQPGSAPASGSVPGSPDGQAQALPRLGTPLDPIVRVPRRERRRSREPGRG